MAKEMRRDPEGFRREIFTDREIAYCEARRYPARHYAARIAAKEAVLKALARGIVDEGSWREVEIRNGRSGRPVVVLHGRTRARAARLRVKQVHLSLSHTSALAAASVVLET